MRRIAGWLPALLLTLAVSTFADGALADAAPPQPPTSGGIPELVWIVAIEGEPQDSVLRAAFELGIKRGLDRDVLHTEGDVPDPAPTPRRYIPNRFRQLFGSTGEGAWQLQVAVAGGSAPAPGRDARPQPFTDVTLVIHSPAMIAANARPLPVRWRITAAAPPGSAEAYAFSLGEAVSLLALEHMHRLLDELAEDERIPVRGFVRSPVLEKEKEPPVRR